MNTWLSTASKLALHRLAVRYSVTKRDMLEKLILEKDSRVTKSLEKDDLGWEKYLSAQKEGVTQ